MRSTIGKEELIYMFLIPLTVNSAGVSVGGTKHLLFSLDFLIGLFEKFGLKPR